MKLKRIPNQPHRLIYNRNAMNETLLFRHVKKHQQTYLDLIHNYTEAAWLNLV